MYDGPAVVLCPLFFEAGQEHLAKMKKNLDNEKSNQHNADVMGGKAKLLLHEMAHLSALVGENDVRSSNSGG
ncbi:hypothetical protein PG997_002521 [Apiospora hydei]|uniref:Lysine-specific metallo-endopeptidase domain-containing protein n=1 Tax=Apiospora hydei TaxID=1337664 RepID=A0ABR1WWM7_9PEZI